MLARLPTTATASGVRVSCRPRSTPVAASISSSGTAPSSARWRYVAARSATRWPGAEQSDQRAGERQCHEAGQGPDQGGQPEPVDALGERPAGVAGPQLTRHRGRGAVGQEDAQADQGAEHGGGDAERGQLRRAEVADDGRVGQQEQRLGHECEEGGHGQAQDLPILSSILSSTPGQRARYHGVRLGARETCAKPGFGCGYRVSEGLCRQTHSPVPDDGLVNTSRPEIFPPHAEDQRNRRSEAVFRSERFLRPQRDVQAVHRSGGVFHTINRVIHKCLWMKGLVTTANQT